MSFSDKERELFALPAQLGGLGIIDPTKCSQRQFNALARLSEPLAFRIQQNNSCYPEAVRVEQKHAKAALHSQNHDQIRDLFAEFLTEVCPNVSSEPARQPISGETFSHRIANTDDGARLDVKEFLGDCSRSCAFFDI